MEEYLSREEVEDLVNKYFPCFSDEDLKLFQASKNLILSSPYCSCLYKKDGILVGSIASIYFSLLFNLVEKYFRIESDNVYFSYEGKKEQMNSENVIDERIMDDFFHLMSYKGDDFLPNKKESYRVKRKFFCGFVIGCAVSHRDIIFVNDFTKYKHLHSSYVFLCEMLSELEMKPRDYSAKHLKEYLKYGSVDGIKEMYSILEKKEIKEIKESELDELYQKWF